MCAIVTRAEHSSLPPHLDGPVQAARDDALLVPVQGEAGHSVVVAEQHRGAVAGVHLRSVTVTLGSYPGSVHTDYLPHPDGLVPAAADQPVRLGLDGEHGRGVAPQCLHADPRPQLPHLRAGC